jgi:hypothetical protein
LLLAATLLLLPASGGVSARQLPEPGRAWRTVRTAHFEVHYPVELESWTRGLLERLESVRAAVSGLVGSAPERRVTVVVDDPANVANGSAWPGPAIFFWPTPAGPGVVSGEDRGWTEIVAVHEYAHIAHLTRPSRDPWNRRFSALLPVPLEPTWRTAPRWVIEGYATWVEGEITGSGRPHGVWRPAVLRRWALEGRLPSYGAISVGGGFLGGSMAYLAGSAFLEWLIARSGEASLPALWARLTALRKRTFGEAFAGVFGGPPEELYGRFTAELTGRALAVEATLIEAGLATGEQVQRLEGSTGAPALSPDGTYLALVLRPEGAPSRLVVWRTAPDTITVAEEEAERRARERDPEDVPDVPWRPRPKEPVAVLHPVAGRGHTAPRWLPDGRLLVVRSEPLPDGRLRPDLFIWDWRHGTLQRITRGAALHEADPDPDGRTAVALRSLGGRTDLVSVDLAGPGLRMLVEGDLDHPFSHPRVSPDGRRIVVSRQEGGLWRLYLLERDGSGGRPIGPEDGASRYEAAWLPDGERLVCTSTAGGIPDLELLDIAGGKTRPLTRVTGAAFAPAPDPAGPSVWFLELWSRGWDLRRLPDTTTDIGPPVTLDPTLTPAIPRPVETGVELAPAPVPPARPYGLGPRRHVLLPQAGYAREGRQWGLTLAQTDPIGRLTLTLSGSLGDSAFWRGLSLRAAWRGPLIVEAGGFDIRSAPVRLEEVGYRGGLGRLAWRRTQTTESLEAAVGYSAGRLERELSPAGDRTFILASLRVESFHTPAGLQLAASLDLQGARGSTAGAEWIRWLGALTLGAGEAGAGRLGGTLWYGRLQGGADPFERFAVGGPENGLIEPGLLTQRIPMPALATGWLTGERFAAYRTEYRVGEFTLWYWGGTTRETLDGWEKLYGMEVVLNDAGIPWMRIPGVDLRMGWAQRVDDPSPRRNRFWIGLAWRP